MLLLIAFTGARFFLGGGVDGVCKFHLAVMILAGANVDLKSWHFESAVCCHGLWDVSRCNQGDFIDLVGWCTCV